LITGVVEPLRLRSFFGSGRWPCAYLRRNICG